MSVEEVRNDVFLSFHGSEVLYPLGAAPEDDGVYTMRNLARTLIEGGVLQGHWVNKMGRIGKLEVFFDDTKLTNSPDGRIKKTIVDGLLQTRGGGVVAILASKGYFKSKWCRFELLSALELETVGDAQERVRLCLIGVGMSVKELDHATSFLREQGFCEKFQYQLVDLEVDCFDTATKRGNVAKKIADWILRRGNGLVAGKTVEKCRTKFVEEMVRVLQTTDSKHSLMAHFDINSEDRLLLDLSRTSKREPHFFLEQFREYLCERPETAEIKTCKKKLTAFENKWMHEMDWDGVRERLDEMFAIASRHDAVKFKPQKDSVSVCPTEISSSDSSSTSSDGSADFVGLDFSARWMDNKWQSWNANVIERAKQMNKQLSQLEKFGKIQELDTITVKRSRGKGWLKERVVLRLNCVIELRNDLQPHQLARVRVLCERLEKMLKECGATKADIEDIMVGSLWKGSLYMLLEVQSHVIQRLFVKLKKVDMNLPLGDKDVYISGLSPAFLVTIPSSANVSNPQGLRPPDVWLWKNDLENDGLQLLLPTTENAREQLLRGGLALKDLAVGDAIDGLFTSLPLVKTISDEQNVVLMNQGHLESLYALGVSYFNGDGVSQDKKRGVELFQKAANQGHVKSIYMLGLCYSNGDGVDQDNKQAVELFQKAANQGHVESIYNLGVCYSNGDGVIQDKKRAVELFQKAADLGHLEAIFNLSLCYQSGNGVEQDFKHAAKLFHQAADQGHVESIYNLGICYKRGDGVEQDFKHAAKLFHQAATEGYSEAWQELSQVKVEAVFDCQNIGEFIAMYDDKDLVGASLERLRVAQKGKDPETWAKEWAVQLGKDDEEAWALNLDRKLCLQLLFTLCDRWKGDWQPKTLSTSDVVDRFGTNRIMGILGPCLVMDRANALYNMTLPGRNERGMHWVSKLHVERSHEWKERLKECGGRPTMNKRFLWLMEDPALQDLKLDKNEFIQRLTTPTVAPWSRAA